MNLSEAIPVLAADILLLPEVPDRDTLLIDICDTIDEQTLLAAIEDLFNIEISDEEDDELVTLGDLIDLASAKGARVAA